MRKQELDNWVKSGGDLPQNLTDNEGSYLKGLGWECNEEWWDHGVKRFEIHFLHVYAHGKYERWYDNGQKFREYNYLNGKKHGKCAEWYKNGQKLFEGNYHHGKEHGVEKRWMWLHDGKLEEHKEYAYGILLKDFLK